MPEPPQAPATLVTESNGTIKLRATSATDVINQYDIRIYDTTRKQWSVGGNNALTLFINRGTYGDTQARRSGILLHETVALWGERFGFPESSTGLASVKEGFVKARLSKDNGQVFYASGLHNAALVSELAHLTEIAPEECTCDYAKERGDTAHVGLGGGEVHFQSKIKEVVDFICACEDGEKEEEVLTGLYKKTFKARVFDNGGIWIGYSLLCREKITYGRTSIGFYS